MTLDERKARVLRAVVEEYIETGMPVGSRVIAKRYRLGVSPATIRNEMADLEDTGYLDKPHTSSGRVPSDRGYRFYVDELMPKKKLTADESRAIESLFRTKMRDVVSFLREVVRVVSETSHYLGFVLGPDCESVTFRSIHILPASSEKALLVLITDIGFVETCLIESDVPSEELAGISEMLSRNLTGVTMDRVADKAYSLLKEETSRYAMIVDQVVEFLRSVTMSEGERLYVGSPVNLLNLPEFRDVERLKGVMAAIESNGILKAILTRSHDETSPTIRIGVENEDESIRDISMVYGTFSAGSTEGKVGILGPKRMDYSKAVAIVSMLEDRLSGYFARNR
ncbi:MAG TPA: heat-inducible transcription repressor HrcA [Firmicutes bacterium]|nr:heat-inducible transcription repressor HrcA [Candidatus Fermentithermobacillaceae bacterium]